MANPTFDPDMVEYMMEMKRLSHRWDTSFLKDPTHLVLSDSMLKTLKKALPLNPINESRAARILQNLNKHLYAYTIALCPSN